MAFVYILRSLKDSKKYIGSTINLEQRLKQHNSGQVMSTKQRRPLKLIGYQYFETIEEAALFEKRYKRSHNWLLRMIKAGKVITLDGM